MKKWLFVVAVVLLTLPCAALAGGKMPMVKLVTTKGDIVLSLDSAHAPKTVDNFLRYVKDGHYDGTIFHRVIAGFMIQGGGFDEQMNQKPTRPPIANEADNGLTNEVGTIAMARTQDPHSASAQFFINVKKNDFLNHRAKSMKGWGYCVFGKVVSGMNVVRAIENERTTILNGMPAVPATPIVITKAEVVDAK